MSPTLNPVHPVPTNLIIATIIALLLSGCQSFQTKPVNLTSKQQNQQLTQTHNWQAKGKISLQFKDERQNASFTWNQKENDFTVHLFGPLGQGSILLRQSQGLASLESSGHGKKEAQTPEQLMQDTLGWQVPISNLQHWIKGTPLQEINTSEQRMDKQGFITAFKQQGWQIKYLKRQRNNGWLLPKRIVITQDNMRLVIIVKDWKI